MLAGTTNGAGSMYIFLPAEAIDAKRRIDVAMKAGVYQQISKTSSNYIPKSMKVTHHVIIVFLCQNRAQ